MRFEFKSSIDQDRVKTLVEEQAALVGVPENAVDCVVIADNYGEAIAEVLGQFGARTHTETKKMKGSGKTIPKCGGGGDVRSTIIYPSSTLRQAFEYLDPNFRGDRAKAGQYHYAISHELGHGIDYTARNTIQPTQLDFNEPFRVGTHDQYWTRLLLEEFFTCVHSGSAVSDDVLQEMISQKRQGIDYFLEFVFDRLAAFWRKEADALVLQRWLVDRIQAMRLEGDRSFFPPAAPLGSSGGQRQRWMRLKSMPSASN